MHSSFFANLCVATSNSVVSSHGYGSSLLGKSNCLRGFAVAQKRCFDFSAASKCCFDFAVEWKLFCDFAVEWSGSTDSLYWQRWFSRVVSADSFGCPYPQYSAERCCSCFAV